MARQTPRAAERTAPGITTQPLPHDDEAERLVLGTVMGTAGTLADVRQMLDAEAFYTPLHRHVWQAVTAIADEGGSPDPVSVRARMERDGHPISPADIMRLAACHTYTPWQHAAIVHDKAMRRRFWNVGAYLVSGCMNEGEDILDIIDRARGMLDDMLGAGRLHTSTLAEALRGVMDRVGALRAGDTAPAGTPTGLRPWDERGGLQRTDLVVIAGETSQGKTSLALSIALAARRPMAYYSLEMKKEQVAARLLSMETGVAVSDICTRPLPDDALARLTPGVTRLSDMPVYFDDRTTAGLDSICESIRSMHIRHGIEGAVVDYLQILSFNTRADTRKEQLMAEAARRLKNLARELDIWIIALSQLNREQHDAPPTLGRLRDSGQIAEAADMVVLVYRPSAYGRTYPHPYDKMPTRDTAMIDIAKGRNVGCFRFIASWDTATTRFTTRQE